MQGIVYLVGAGPGDPGLITVKGAELLRQADLVVHDRLASADLLALAEHADLVYMGKEPDTPGEFQQLINDKLVSAAEQGKTVVRLKGGDPFVFGRGGEEAIALRRAGVKFEVVPGITSAIAVPAYAGVPVTHRGISAAFTVVTGSEDPSKPHSSLDWAALAKTPGTLVLLMGWQSLPAIVESLVKYGRALSTPASITQWGTLTRQRSVDGTLEDIVAKGRDAGLGSPVVTTIGDVASLRSEIRWFDQRPLFGKRVLVTRSRTQAGVLSTLLGDYGAEAIELPTIDIVPLKDTSDLKAIVGQLGEYDWVIFTSTNGVDAFFSSLYETGRDARAFGDVKIAAIGPATASALTRQGIIPDLVPKTYTTTAIVEALDSVGIRNASVLLPRADIAPDSLANGLRNLGANLREVDAYRTITPTGASAIARKVLASGTIDALTFTSSSTVRNLVSLLDGDTTMLNACRVISIGPVTSDTAREFGVRVDTEAKEHTIPGLVKATVELIGNE